MPLRPATAIALTGLTLLVNAGALDAAQSAVRVPPAGRLVNTTHPTRVIGRGTPGSCTSAAVVAAVRAGGIIRFSCGRKPVVILMRQTAKVLNTRAEVVLDGRGLVTLSGGGRRRILYMDTCDHAQIWTTSHCQDQRTPRLVIQNMRFVEGNSAGEDFDGGGGGAVFDRGGQLRIIDSVFAGNRCERTGPDIGGAAIRALSQFDNRPVYVVGSRFTGGICSNGGALSSIGVSWTVLNSTFTDNRAIGKGANPPRAGTPGGGSGGAIYNDGDLIRLTVAGSTFEGNRANEGGGAIIFVSDNSTGTLTIRNSALERNPNRGFQTAGLPGIFFLGAHRPTITASVLR